MLIVRTLCQLMDQIRPKTENPFTVYTLYFINIMSYVVVMAYILFLKYKNIQNTN